MGALGINIWMFLSQLVSFAVLFIVLARWGFPALTRTLDKRAQTIREGVENAEKARQQLAEAEKRIAGMMEEARLESQRTLEQALKAGAHVRAEIETEARARAQQTVEQAQTRIQQEVAQARTELRQEVADLAILAAERVIGGSLDNATNRRLVNEFVALSRE
jgi:F-type H+-transporting ATPase subunit b